ncbi:MAG TPA: signal peptidase II [Acidobacteriota bacterium]|nr:signal peptidase II [Acidobacteriota bacterium]
MSSNWKNRSQYLLISLVVFLVDQITKTIVVQGMDPHQSIDVIPNLFNITYVHNRGAVFGLGSNFSAPYLSWMLSILSIVSLGIILFYFLRVRTTSPRLYTGLALVLGGALGNLYDRLKNGYVVDFLDMHWFEHHWPFFNVADLSICLGVGLLLISMPAAAENQNPTTDTSNSA